MISTRQRRPHRLTRALGWTAGVVLVALAALMALAQLLLPLLARHPQWVAAQLGARLQRPVAFASLEGHWRASGPLFVMHDISVGAAQGGQPLHLPEAQLELDFGGWLLPSRHVLNLRARGLELDIGRDAGGQWHVNGIGVAGGGASQPLSLGPLSLGLWLDDLRLDIADQTNGRHYRLLARTLLLDRQGERIRFGVALRREGAAGGWRGAGSFREDGSQGRVWLAGEQVDLHALLGDIAVDGYTASSGHGSLAAWLDWRHGKVVRATLRADLDDLAVAGPAGTAVVPRLHGTAALARLDDGHELRWAGDDGGAFVLALHASGDGALRAGFAARRLQLAPLLPWLALKPDLSPGLAQWLGGGRPHGVLDQASLRWSRAAGVEQVQADFRDAGIDAVGKLPGVSALAGTLRGDAEALALELPAQASTLAFPHVFRKPFVMARLAGELALWHADGAWHVGTDALDFEGEGFGGQARGEAALPDGGGRPFLDLYARLDHAAVPAAKLFWPVNDMPPSAMAWLDQALVDGQVTEGAALVRGSLADWPFRHNEGRFEARGVIDGAVLDYGRGWPRAEGVHAVASFVDNGMLVEASAGQSLGNKAERAVALIPDFADTTLDLNVQGSGTGASMLEFLRRSPIASAQADVLSKLKLGGSGRFAFHLSLPVKDASQMVLSGQAQLKDMDLAAPEWKLALDRLSGPLVFDAHGVRAGPLQGGFRGQPSTLDVDIAAATGRPDTVLAARLAGSYGMAELVQDVPALAWLKDAGAGRSDFAIGLEVTRAGANAAWTPTLSLDSTLAGMRLDLPVPLQKPAAASLPLHLALPLPAGSADLQLAVADVLRARLRLPRDGDRPLAGTVAFGTAMPDALPDAGLRIRGKAAKLDVSGWVQQAVAGAAGGDGPGLESIDVNADQALLFGRAIPAMHILAAPKGGVLGIDASSEALAGHFDVPTQDLRRRGITAQLQRLHWPKDNTPAPPGAAAAAPAANPAATGIDPAALPPFHLLIDDLRLGEARLGQARLETWPTATGLHIDQLRALSKKVQITAGGDWDGNAADSHTRLRIDFAADDLGSLLGALGFEGLFEGGKTQARLDARWPGAPSSLALANMDGTLKVDVSNGRIPEVGPGVGRLFGLVSVGELPRRLTLDFGDVFGKGLAFDSITGDFRLGGGNAVTDNLKIEGPAAEISIKGRTGLRAKDYDQQVLVVPHVGSSLPVVGAVVAGPVGAAAGLAVQGILGRGLNKAAAARYRVTGTWDKPVMTLVEKRNVPVRPPLAEPALPASAAPPAGH